VTQSWIIRNRATQEVIYETYLPKFVAALNTEKYEAVPVLDCMGVSGRFCQRNGEQVYHYADQFGWHERPITSTEIVQVWA
jgi:hypothetical protein